MFMAKAIELAPDPHLLESMRAVGYTAETAIADLIDNSIAAGATVVDVLSTASGPPRVAIFDDGCGMDRDTCLSAMRLAARSPSETRGGRDLGRFGLGLKTASLSQCRRLTVASKRAGVVTVLRWDLDHVVRTAAWEVIEVDQLEAGTLLGWNLLEESAHGTLVVWDDLDLFSMTEGSEQHDFDGAMMRVRAHCELVFHRFVAGDGVPEVDISFNGTAVASLDPFLRSAKATQHRQEVIRVAGEALPVHAYTLPFINKMTAEQKRKAMTTGSLRDSQGFYIYRAGRLVIWGTWFRLNPKSELGKLARVQVDVPNSLDSLWALDIKKSQATPPKEMREQLRNLASQMIAPSQRVQKFRGRRVKTDDSVVRYWDLVTERADEFKYEINRDHPAIQRLAGGLTPEQLRELENVLEGVQGSFPVLDAHNRLGQDAASLQNVRDEDSVVRQALALRDVMSGAYPDEEDFIRFLGGIEPYSDVRDFDDKYRRAARSAD